MYSPIKVEESWRIRMYKEINVILQWPDTVKFIRSLKDGLDILERRIMKDCQNKVVTVRIEGMRKREGPWKKRLKMLKKI